MLVVLVVVVVKVFKMDVMEGKMKEINDQQQRKNYLSIYLSESDSDSIYLSIYLSIDLTVACRDFSC